LQFDVVACELNVGDSPVVQLVRPLSTSLDLHVLLSRDELVDDQVLQSDLAGQFSDTVHQVFALSVDDFLHVLHLVFGDRFTLLDTLNLLIDGANLVNAGSEALLVVELLFFFPFYFLGQTDLLPPTLFNVSLLLQKFLLLLDDSGLSFISSVDFVLHFHKSLVSLSGLLVFSLFIMLLGLKLFNQNGLLLFSNFSLGFDLSFLLFKLLSDIFLLLFNLVLHLLHLFLVLHKDDLVCAGTSTSTRLGLTSSSFKVNSASRVLGKLLSEASDLVTEFPDHCVLRILVDLGFILNVFGARSVSKSGKGFLCVVVGGSDSRNHDGLRVTTEGVL